MTVLEILGVLLIILFIFVLGFCTGAKCICGEKDSVPSIPGPLYFRVRNLLLRSMLKGIEIERAHKSLIVDDLDKEIDNIIDGFSKFS